MSTAPRRLVIVEPCLEAAVPGVAGSHAGRFVTALVNAAGRRHCTVVARRGFVAGAEIPADCTVHATLPFGPHSKVTAAGELDRLDARGRRRRLEPPWAEWQRRRRREERIGAFAAAVAPALAPLRAGDTVFVATASELEAAGLARALARASLPAGVTCHVLFHMAVERGFRTDRARQRRRLDRVGRLLAGAIDEAAPHRIEFHATTPELAAQYARLGVAPCGVLPYPVVVPRRPPDAGRTGAALRIAALGDARPEKNSHRLAEIVDAVAARSGPPVTMSFAVQDNLGFAPTSAAPEHEAVRRGLAALRERPTVELVGGPLDDAAYVEQLHRADVALLAYDQERYRTRLSAILLESLVAGAVPLVTGGGWMARQLADAQRDHVARIAAGAVGRQRLGFVGARTVRHAGLTVGCAVPAGTMALVVEAAWTRHGTDALAEPPLRLSWHHGPGAHPADGSTVVCAPTTGGAAALLIPLTPIVGPSTATLRASPVSTAVEVEIGTLAVDALLGRGPPPAGAAGAIVADIVDVPAALVEISRHLDHYRRGAAALGATLATCHSPAALLDRLDP